MQNKFSTIRLDKNSKHNKLNKKVLKYKYDPDVYKAMSHVINNFGVKKSFIKHLKKRKKKLKRMAKTKRKYKLKKKQDELREQKRALDADTGTRS